jgi:hypothetical protein
MMQACQSYINSLFHINLALHNRDFVVADTYFYIVLRQGVSLILFKGTLPGPVNGDECNRYHLIV